MPCPADLAKVSEPELRSDASSGLCPPDPEQVDKIPETAADPLQPHLFAEVSFMSDEDGTSGHAGAPEDTNPLQERLFDDEAMLRIDRGYSG